MKKLILLTIISSLAFIQSCSDKGETFDGIWKTQDIDYDFDITCDCSEEERANFKEVTAKTIQRNMKNMASGTSLYLTDDYKMSGYLLNEKVAGTYSTDGDKLILDVDQYSSNEEFNIIHNGEEILFSKDSDKDDLEKMTQSFSIPEVGDIIISFSKLKITLDKE